MKVYIGPVLFILVITITAFIFYVPETEKTFVTIVEKKYIPAWNGAGEQSSNEQYLLYVKRVNNTSFFLKYYIRIVQTNEESYNNLKIGDTLSKKY